MSYEPLNASFCFRRTWRTLRFRLAAWNALVLAIVALVMLLGVRQGVRWALFHEIDQMLLDEAQEVSLTVEDAQSDELPLLIEDLMRKAESHSQHGWFVVLFNSETNVVWSSKTKGNPPRPLIPGRNLIPYTDGDVRIVEARLRPGQLHITGVRIGARLFFINRDLAHVDRLMFFAAAALVLIAPLCGYWLAGRAAHTLGDIIHTASRLRPSHLDERLKLRGTEDELDQLAHTINGLLDRIAVYIQHKRDFLANAAHELRTPLAAIRSSIEVALSGDRTSDEYAILLEDLIDQATALQTLVNQLLLISETEMESGPWRQEQEQVALREIIVRAVEMFQGVAETKNIDLQVESASDAIVPGNRQHLRQVINNLVDNAIKYTQENGQIRVNLEVSKREKTARFTVTDNGIGISQEDVPHVFERFFRADRSRSRTLSIDGTGLGLSICEAVVNAHGGKIICHSKLGQGTTMEVILPLATTSPASTSKPKQVTTPSE